VRLRTKYLTIETVLVFEDFTSRGPRRNILLRNLHHTSQSLIGVRLD
jgi:hypothetical protein